MKKQEFNSSDPFSEINDEENELAHIALQREMIKENIFEQISRGNYKTQWLIDRYSNDIFDSNEIMQLIREVKRFIMDHHFEFDPKLEVFGFFSTNARLKESMFDLLENYRETNKPRTVIDIVKTIDSLDKTRFDMMRTLGYDIQRDHEIKQEQEKQIDNKEQAKYKQLVEQGEQFEHS